MDVHGSVPFLVGSRCCGSCHVWAEAGPRGGFGVLQLPIITAKQRWVRWLSLLLNMSHTGSPGKKHDSAWSARAAAHTVETPHRPATCWEETSLLGAWLKAACPCRSHLLPEDAAEALMGCTPESMVFSCPVPGWAPQPTGTRFWNQIIES